MGRSLRVGIALCLAACVATPLAATAAPIGGTAASPSISKSTILHLAGVPAPRRGLGLIVHGDWPASHPYRLGQFELTAITAKITPSGKPRLVSAVPAQPASAPSVPTTPVDACTDPAFAPDGVHWSRDRMPIHWRFRPGSVPRGVNRFLTRRSVRLAHHVWPQVRTNCSKDPRNNFRFHYDGKTRKGVGFNHVNGIDFGRLANNALALNYTWYKRGRILEVDLRFNRTQYHWTNKKRSHAFQLIDVATHELGHQLGLDDLSAPHGGLTMYGLIGRGELKKVTLGRGDMRGASSLSP